MFTFSVFDQKYPFWANLVQKLKIVCSELNLIPTLIRIFRIQWRCSFICFRLEIPFLGKLRPKNKNCQFRLKFGTLTNLNMKNSALMLMFGEICFRKLKFFVEAET